MHISRDRRPLFKEAGQIQIYQIPKSRCIIKLTPVIPIQQQNPIIIGLPPVLISLTILVFKPIALIAITMKNLLRVFTGLKIADGTPKLVATVVITDASTK